MAMVPMEATKFHWVVPSVSKWLNDGKNTMAVATRNLRNVEGNTAMQESMGHMGEEGNNDTQREGVDKKQIECRNITHRFFS